MVIPESELKLAVFLNELFVGMPIEEEKVRRVKEELQKHLVLTIEDVELLTEQQMKEMEFPIGIRNRITNIHASKV